MSEIIVGVSQREGEYQGVVYNNIIFHCTKPFEQGKGFGVQVKTYKVKRRVFAEIFGDLTDKELAELIGQGVEFFFNEYQQVKYIEIQQPPK